MRASPQPDAALPRPSRPAVSSRGRRTLLWLLLLLLGAAAAFSVLVRVDRVVVGRGRLVALDERTDVRLATGGVVAEVLAATGERVKAGQVLLRLEDASGRGRLERLRQELERTQHERATLAEAAGAVEQTLATGEARPVADPAAARALDAWRQARDRQADEVRRRETVVPGRVQLARQRVAARQASIASVEADLKRAERELAREQSLLGEGLTRQDAVDAAVARRDSLLGRLQEVKAELLEEEKAIAMIALEADESLAAAEQRVASAEAGLRDELSRLRADHAATAAEIATLEAECEATTRLLGHHVVHAPVSGLLAFAAPVVPGDRVEADDHVFSVSTSSYVTAEAQFANRDAGGLRAGAPCKLKLDAYPFERFGVLRARVESIALEPVVDPSTGESVYPVRLSVQRAAAARGPAPMVLRPGLALSAEVVTERPRVISLFFEPVRRLLGDTAASGPATAAPSSTDVPEAARHRGTPFDGTRAFRDLEALAGLGPRPFGSDALARARSHVAAQMEAAGWQVAHDEFRTATPGGERVFHNLLARRGADPEGPTLLLATHLDTRRLEGVSGFQGANEGASGAAVLIECARVLATSETPVPLRLAFLDGKEALGRAGPRDGLYGSHALAQRLGTSGEVCAVIVCDMVGDAQLQFTDDLRSTPRLADALLDAGRRLGYERLFERAHPDAIPFAVRNDHVPFLHAGVPAALLCDFDFGGADPVRRTGRNRFWRTGDDRIERCSARSLQVAGDVLVETVLRFARDGGSDG